MWTWKIKCVLLKYKIFTWVCVFVWVLVIQSNTWLYLFRFLLSFFYTFIFEEYEEKKIHLSSTFGNGCCSLFFSHNTRLFIFVLMRYSIKNLRKYWFYFSSFSFLSYETRWCYVTPLNWNFYSWFSRHMCRW